MKDNNFDQTIRETFSAVWQKAAKGDLDNWLDSPRGAIVIIIVIITIIIIIFITLLL